MNILFRKKLNQAGVLSLHSIIPILLVAVAIGGVGAYVLHKSKAATPSAQAIGNGYFVMGGASYTTGGLDVKDPYGSGTSKLKLTDTSGVELANGKRIASFAWSPSSYKIALSIVEPTTSDGFTRLSVYVANYNGSGLTKVYTPSPQTEIQQEFLWSPDSTQLAVATLGHASASNTIYLYSASGALISTKQISSLSMKGFMPSGSKLFLVSGNPHDLTYLDLASNQIVTNPATGLDKTNGGIVDIIDENTFLIRDMSTSTSQYSKYDAISGAITNLATSKIINGSPTVSNNRSFILNAHSTSVDATSNLAEIVRFDGTIVSIPSKCTSGQRFMGVISPDSKKIAYGCYASGWPNLTYSYDIATAATSIIPNQFPIGWAAQGEDYGSKMWQPSVTRVSSKTCVSGSYTMKSDVTFGALSTGRRIINPVAISPMVGSALQGKKVDYTVTVQTVKAGVWTTIQTLGPLTSTTTGTFKLNPTDPLEYGISGTRVIISSGVYGDAKANCSVTHYSS